ncbi:MAG: UDP-glucose 4-epimerase GalE [Methylocella sp.]
MESDASMFPRGKVLVTGGAGYIGSHVCKLLAAEGILPVVYDNFVYGHAHAVKWGPLIEGDLENRSKLVEVINEYSPDAIIHFAAYTYVGESVSDPAKYYENNIIGTLSLLDAMRRTGINIIVFSSTAATYGNAGSTLIDERTLQKPTNPYGWTKLIMEQALHDYAAAYSLRYVALRYFNACGADLDGEIGEEHSPETHLIPRALMAVAGEIPYLELYGDDYDTPDGTCLRDYIHVADLARGHIAALNYLRSGGESCALNLGSGRATSVKEILAAVERITGKKAPVKMGGRRAGDPPILVANPKRAKELLEFVTQDSGIDTIVRSAWRFYQKRLAG